MNVNNCEFVKIVRCKNYKYWTEFLKKYGGEGKGTCPYVTHTTRGDGFCSEGEEKHIDYIKEAIADLQEDVYTLEHDKTLTDEERKIASDIGNAIALLEPMEWIPCEERLPTESDGTVLICMPDKAPYNSKEPYIDAKHNQRVKTGTYSQHSRRWYIGDMMGVGKDEPIAWMRFPREY